MRKKDQKTKALERNEDSKNPRGLTTDQLINLQSVRIQKQKYNTSRTEVAMAGLSMQNEILNTMIVRAERRAEMLCPSGDSEHPAWKVVDDLVAQQSDLMSSMNNFTTTLVKEHHNADNSDKDSNLVDLVDDDGRLGKEIDIVDTDINSAVTSSSLKVTSPPKHQHKTTTPSAISPKQKAPTATTNQSSSSPKQKVPTATTTQSSTSAKQKAPTTTITRLSTNSK